MLIAQSVEKKGHQSKWFWAMDFERGIKFGYKITVGIRQYNGKNQCITEFLFLGLALLPEILYKNNDL